MNAPPRRPRLRASAAAAHDGRTLVVTALADGEVHEYDADDRVAAVVRELDGSSTIAEIEARHGAVAADVVAVLHDDGLLTDGPVEHLSGRWSNQMRFLADLGDDEVLQGRLRAATVVVIGLGGVGTWVAQHLASAGVGRLVVVDPDTVEESNLNRQTTFEPADVGKRKVAAFASRMATRAPLTAVRPIARTVRGPADLDDLVSDASLVICCADEPSVQAVSGVVADAAGRAGTPAIVGGGYGAAVGAPGVTIVPGCTPCWACIMAAAAPEPDHPLEDVTPPGPSAGSFGPLIGLTGAITSWEASRILLGLPPLLAGRIRDLDVMTLAWRDVDVPMRPGCPCSWA